MLFHGQPDFPSALSSPRHVSSSQGIVHNLQPRHLPVGPASKLPPVPSLEYSVGVTKDGISTPITPSLISLGPVNILTPHSTKSDSHQESYKSLADQIWSRAMMSVQPDHEPCLENSWPARKQYLPVKECPKFPLASAVLERTSHCSTESSATSWSSCDLPPFIGDFIRDIDSYVHYWPVSKADNNGNAKIYGQSSNLSVFEDQVALSKYRVLKYLLNRTVDHDLVPRQELSSIWKGGEQLAQHWESSRWRLKRSNYHDTRGIFSQAHSDR